MDKNVLKEIMSWCNVNKEELVEGLIEYILRDLKNNNDEYKNLNNEIQDIRNNVADIFSKLSETDINIINIYEEKCNFARAFEYEALLTFEKKKVSTIFDL